MAGQEDQGQEQPRQSAKTTTKQKRNQSAPRACAAAKVVEPASAQAVKSGWASKLHTTHDRGEASEGCGAWHRGFGASMRCGIQTRLPQQQRCPTNLQFNSAQQNRTIVEDALEDPKEGESRSRQKMQPGRRECGIQRSDRSRYRWLFSFGQRCGLRYCHHCHQGNVSGKRLIDWPRVMGRNKTSN